MARKTFVALVALAILATAVQTAEARQAQRRVGDPGRAVPRTAVQPPQGCVVDPDYPLECVLASNYRMVGNLGRQNPYRYRYFDGDGWLGQYIYSDYGYGWGYDPYYPRYYNDGRPWSQVIKDGIRGGITLGIFRAVVGGFDHYGGDGYGRRDNSDDSAEEESPYSVENSTENVADIYDGRKRVAKDLMSGNWVPIDKPKGRLTARITVQDGAGVKTVTLELIPAGNLTWSVPDPNAGGIIR